MHQNKIRGTISHYSEIHTKHTNSVGRTWNFRMLNLMAHNEISESERVKGAP